MKVFSKDKFIQYDTNGNYERIPYIKEWVDACNGLSYAEIRKLGYEVMDDYMVEVKDLLTEIELLKTQIATKEVVFNKCRDERTRLLIILEKVMNKGYFDGDDTKYLMDLHKKLGN